VEEEIGTKFVFTIHLNGSQKIIGGRVQNINRADESQEKNPSSWVTQMNIDREVGSGEHYQEYQKNLDFER